MLKATSVFRSVFFCLAVVFLSPSMAIGQPISDQQLPKVMLIGENEIAFEKMQTQYEQTLLGACNNNFDSAYIAWGNVLVSMETYAEQISFDLKGIKIWLYIFFGKDGSIKHIAYYLRPNSRNVSTDELSAFFNSYINRYRISVSDDKRFSHYGTVSFPVLPQQLSDK